MSDQDKPSSPPRPPSIVAARSIRPRSDERLQACRQLLMSRLGEHLAEVFAQVDDTLFDCAEKAENNQVQALFFDSMRDLRRQRSQIERSYHQGIARRFDDYLDGPASEPLPEPDVEHLALVADEDYEETLLVNGMVGRVEARCVQALFGLDKRLVAVQGSAADENRTPFSPRAIAEAFREALALDPLPLRIKTILYMLFDRHVMEALDGLYDALNQRLIDAGVLPDLKYSGRSTPPRPASSGPSRSASMTGGADPRESFLESLAELLEECRQDSGACLPGHAPSIASLTPASASGTYSPTELLDVLNRLQRDAAREMPPSLQQPQRVEGFKQTLHQRLEQTGPTPRTRSLAPRDADVIDLIGMLFDFILDDDGLPDSCKTVLSHLHTPYLRLALQDRSLFSEPAHPARRLLNGMAKAGTLYGEERDLLDRMRATVRRVIQEFQGDLSLFERLLADFDADVAQIEHRVTLRERRAVEAVRGRDRLLEARRAAATCIGDALQAHSPATPIQTFLERTWIDVLAFVHLRHGEQGDDWRRAVQAAWDLAWSGGVAAAEDDARLQALRPSLFEALGQGLENLGGHHADAIRRQLQELQRCQEALTSPPPVEAPPAPERGEVPGDWHDDALEETPAEALPPDAERLLESLRAVEFGTWFEFNDSQPPRLLKLSWFSPTSRNYMFVDQAGQRVAVKSVERLALDMARGTVRRLSEERAVPLVDRALDAIYRALKRIAGRNRRPH
ncbi:DUF1631 domain-containing protein [Pseudomonas mangiferae]|uniref:DUF1631 domain-containing protein n=1 Tax=Pseudomonas mangiferae TaxID=2593654 RepID=A0A553H322_9PSED|nr:DUF1631 domain-containing protein [Pseudomonas mangiferae]TRX76148.1 DUF1631 domain-containing protein [Pseudomonas mangiferae]